MKKMKFFAMTFAAIVAVAFSACTPEEPNNPGNGGDDDGDKTENVTKVQLQTIETFWIQEIDGIEQYQLQSSIKDGNKNVSYVVSIGAYANDQAGLVDGTYNLSSDETTLKPEIIYSFTKQTIEGTDTAQVAAEKAVLVVATEGDNVNYKFNVSYADGVNEEITYNGKVPEVTDANGLWEPETPSTLNISADLCGYGITDLTPYGYDYAQIELILLNQTAQDEAYFIGALTSDENKKATELPTGTFSITAEGMMGDDFFFPGTYFDQYPYIYASETEGMYWPQSGTITINKDGENYTITMSVLSYYGSTLNINFTGEAINLYETSNSPMRIAPKNKVSAKAPFHSAIKPIRIVK